MGIEGVMMYSHRSINCEQRYCRRSADGSCGGQHVYAARLPFALPCQGHHGTCPPTSQSHRLFHCCM